MKQLLSLKTFLLTFSVLFGIFYYALIQLSVEKIEHSISKESTFSFTLNSNIDQNVKLQIAAERYKLRLVKCNSVEIAFPRKKMQWFEGVGEQVSFFLKKGENRCSVETDNFHKPYLPRIKQKVTFFDFSILFMLIGIPLFHLLFNLFIWGLDQIKRRTGTVRLDVYVSNNRQSELPKLLLMLVFAGVAIRVLYFQKFGIMNFQHDWHGHIEFIKYIANNWTLPLASKGLEYPQQPLYYLIAGGIYAVLTNFGLNDQDALYGLGYFSLFCSMVFLFYAYRFVSLLTPSVWVRSVAMLFVSLTPSLVYLSARINNDSLVMALSAFTLYYIVKSYRSKFREGFYFALTGVSLLFMTKISAAPMELLLFGLLLLSYFQLELDVKDAELTALKRKIYLFSIVGVFLLTFTLLRVYLPVEGTLHLVNSSANYPNQKIEALDFLYFGTFHIVSLINAGYSHVYGEDLVRYSFLTYQYGTMFFGEFDYTYFIEKSEGLREVMKAILLFGLVFVVAFLSYLIHLHRASLLLKFLFATLFLNLLLVLKFMYAFPVVCNTDFRYFVSSFVLFAFIFAQGLSYVKEVRYMGYIVNGLLVLLVVAEVLFFALLLL